MSKKKIKAAVIGAGNIGFKFSLMNNNFPTTHWEAYLSNPKIELVAVADKEPTAALRGAGEKFGVKVYTDYDRLLEQEQPELVSIATPDQTHAAILARAANTPSVRGIWCEKPLAISLREAREMVSVCQRKKICLLVNFVRRYDELYVFLKQNLLKLVGETQAVTFYYSGGIVTVGSHLLDLLYFLFGPITRVDGRAENGGINGRVWCGELLINIVPLPTGPYSIFEMNIFGSKARFDVINKPFGEYEYRHVVLETARTGSVRYLAKTEQRPLKKTFPREYMDKALAGLVSCVQTGAEPISSGRTALHSLETMHALLYSAEHGGRLCTLPFTKKISRLPVSGGEMNKKLRPFSS